MRRAHGIHAPVLLTLGLVALGITGCGGSYSGDGGGGQSVSESAPDGSASNMQDLFANQVQPNLSTCRTCHVSGAAADVEDGRDFRLTKNPSEDLDNLRSSWERLGGNNPTSRILLMASGQEPHTGGTLWPEGGQAYQSMSLLLMCFDDPEGCPELLADAGDGETPQEQRPLLGSSRGGHAWFDFCEGKDDSAELPADPRSLVQPGVSDGKAVHFNAYWKDCHAYPDRVDEQPHPQTCGELLASAQRGADLMKGLGQPGSGHFFSASSGSGGLFSVSAEAYNKLWRQWGLNQRPEQFDRLVAERFGLPWTGKRNPYPLPGEDPNETNGGSGQLPASMTQIRDEQGNWTGEIGLTCHGCHSGEIGSPEDGEGLGYVFGAGNSDADIGVTSRDLALADAPAMGVFSLFGAARGTNNAAFFNIAALGGMRPSNLLGILTSGSNASGDTPPWWNVGHRPLKFWDGLFPSDATRVDMAFYTPLGQRGAQDWVKANAQDADKWIMSLKSPKYPMDIDEELARQGAILFHNKNLWAENLENPVPEPAGGNGSCAGCHGAYSPRFVHNSEYLETPALEGVASYVVPKAIIGTDPARVDTHNEAVSQGLSNTFIGYPSTHGTDEDCGAQTRASSRGDRKPGYLAPPLYGIWASAPYLHNGSVPTVWALLKPSDRPDLWRRVSKPAPEGLEGDVVMGFDTNLQRAYDQERLGWDYETMSCGNGTVRYLQCNPQHPSRDPLFQRTLQVAYDNLLLAWNLGNATVLGQWTRRQINNRKIYNTHMYSQGNEGHAFTSVLTDAERRALIEYLKTL